MIGKSLSHYRVLKKIGEGGMGVVYKAEDTKLKRTVALKFLPAEMIRDPQAKKRFLQEAQTAAALDHPNICTIHEINEAEGQAYIAMAYVEGKSLKEKLAVGPLAVSEALDIAVQVGEGLKQAHGKGIIHRDIKPGNIMLTEEDRAKIMDFGLAKLASGRDVTRTLTIMGTAAYMSPEQARGEAVDHRTDIWSFGAMLYEMLTGQTPFGRKDDQAAPDSILPDAPALLHSILYDSVEAPSRLRKDLPRPVEQVILKALDKDRNRRYQGIDEVLKDLKTARSPELAFPKPEKSIVILPFENISPDPDQEYFCDGMTEEIITDLSHVRDLLVISRSSAMTFKGTKKKLREIAQEVNVRYVLEGSVRKAGNNLRITAQLIDSATDAHLWAEKYSGTLDNIFDIQEKVSTSIVDALKLKLAPEEKKKLAERPIENVAAYEYFLKAKAEIFKFNGEAIHLAIRYLLNALSILGDNALLYSGLALAYWQLANIGSQGEDLLVKSGEFVNRAIALDPELAQAHAVRGWLCHLKGNPKENAYHAKKALTLSPNEPMALQSLVMVLACFSGKISEAAPPIEQLLKIDPLDSMTRLVSGLCHFYDGQFDRALADFRKWYELYPDNPAARLNYSLALAYCGQKQSAIATVAQMVNAMPDNMMSKMGLFLKYGLREDAEKLSRGLSPDIKWRCLAEAIGSVRLAVFFSMAKAKGEALNWLENAVNLGFINYPYLSEKDPFLANIRGEPRFQMLMERVKYEWEHFDV